MTNHEQQFYAQLGVLIRNKRQARHISQCSLAVAIGVHRNSIRRWEQGEAVNTLELLRIAHALSCNHLVLLPPVGSEGPMTALPPCRFQRSHDLVREPRISEPALLKAVRSERDPAMSRTEEERLRA